MKPKLLLIGAGGHCKVILDLLLKTKKYKISGIIDLKERVGESIFGIKIIGTDSLLSSFFKKGIRSCFISMGSIGDPGLRVKLFNNAKKIGFIFPNLISPNALISPKVVLGEGNYIAPGAIINADTRIGDNCIINTGAIVDHDCKIGNFVHLAPGSVLNGGVCVGNYSHIGAGSTVIQNIKIGEKTIVGAASLVIKNISNNKVAYGSPCRERKNNV